MRTAKLGDLLAEYRELPHGSSSPPVLTLTERNGFIPQADRFRKRLATEDTSKYKIVRRDDIAFNPYLLWAGAVAQNTVVDEGIISPLYPTFRVRPGFDPRYVARLLLTEKMIAAYDTIAFGSVPRRRRSSTKDFLELDVDAPPSLGDQRRIAAILDHCDALRQKRRASLRHFARLDNAILLHMFGDPDDPASTGTSVPLSEIADLEGGRNLVADDDQARSVYRVLKISAVTSGDFKPTESKPLPLEYVPPASHLVRDGDLLISRANTAELVGAVAHVTRTPANLALPDKIWRFVWHDPESVPTFYRTLFRTTAMRRRMSALATGTGGSMKNISKAKLLAMPVPLVPIAEQSEFAKRVNAIPQPSSVEFDELFAAVQYRAFQGEL